MKRNLKQLHEIVDIISKQIVRACINYRVSQGAALESFYMELL